MVFAVAYCWYSSFWLLIQRRREYSASLRRSSTSRRFYVCERKRKISMRTDCASKLDGADSPLHFSVEAFGPFLATFLRLFVLDFLSAVFRLLSTGVSKRDQGVGIHRT